MDIVGDMRREEYGAILVLDHLQHLLKQFVAHYRVQTEVGLSRISSRGRCARARIKASFTFILEKAP